MKRESFGSRLGFILVSAGCAIGIGNVWKFPYICGAYGGAAFILIYLCFLVILGIPVLVAEFAVGRGSHTSVAKCFRSGQHSGAGWHRASPSQYRPLSSERPAQRAHSGGQWQAGRRAGCFPVRRRNSRGVP